MERTNGARLGSSPLIRQRGQEGSSPDRVCKPGSLIIATLWSEGRGDLLTEGMRYANPCRDFMCGWLFPTSPLPDWMRPDNANVILLAANFTWRGLPVNVAVPVGESPKAKALEWLKAFSFEKKRPLLYRIKDDWYAFGPSEFQAEMRDRKNKGQELWE